MPNDKDVDREGDKERIKKEQERDKERAEKERPPKKEN